MYAILETRNFTKRSPCWNTSSSWNTFIRTADTEFWSRPFQYQGAIYQFRVRSDSVKKTLNQCQKSDTHLILLCDPSPACRCSVRRGWVCHLWHLTRGLDSVLVVVDRRKARNCCQRWRCCLNWQFPLLRRCSILPHCRSSYSLEDRSSSCCSLVCWSVPINQVLILARSQLLDFVTRFRGFSCISREPTKMHASAKMYRIIMCKITIWKKLEKDWNNIFFYLRVCFREGRAWSFVEDWILDRTE